jgi:putative polyhydroxyalkanoate system protein
MSRITIHRSHALGREVARERAETLAQRLARDYDVHYQWQGDSLEFKRSGAQGRIDVSENQVAVELKLGLLLSAMGGSIKREIERTLDASLV